MANLESQCFIVELGEEQMITLMANCHIRNAKHTSLFSTVIFSMVSIHISFQQSHSQDLAYILAFNSHILNG